MPNKTKIYEINELFTAFCEAESDSRFYSYFFIVKPTLKYDPVDIQQVQALQQALNLHDFMSFSEILEAITYIEAMTLYSRESKETKYRMDDMLIKNNKLNLDEHLKKIDRTGLPRLELKKSPSAEISDKSGELIKLDDVNDELDDGWICLSPVSEADNLKIELTDKSLQEVITILMFAHDVLCESLVRSYLFANGMDCLHEIVYGHKKIGELEGLKEIIDDTKKLNPTALSMVADMARAGIDLGDQCGEKLRAELQGLNTGEKTNKIKKMIKEFTGGEGVDTPGSKANLIFNYGGQYLEACVLIYFKAHSRIEGDEQQALTINPGFNRGHISWRKQGDDVFALITVKCFACSDDAGKWYALAADGCSIRNLNGSQIEKISKILQNEAADELISQKIHQIAPIAEIKTVIKVERNMASNGYYFNVIEHIVGYSSNAIFPADSPTNDEELVSGLLSVRI